MTNLQSLHLYHNELSGAIPTELGSLTALRTLWLYNNELSGAIPAALGSLTSLRYLLLYNNELSGAIPAALGGLTSIELLYLNNNELSGSIPAALGSLTSLQYLLLHDNDLSGAIPAELGSLNAMTLLSLYDNPELFNYPAALNTKTGLHLLAPSNGDAACLPTTDGGADCAIPTKVDRLLVTAGSPTQIVVRWEPEPATPAPAGYIVQYGTGGWSADNVTIAGATATITGLTPDFVTNVRVRPNSADTPWLQADTSTTAVTLSLAPATVSEGAAATDITVTAGLNGTGLPTATEVTVSRTGGTATSGMDYPAISDFTVTIPANATSGTATLSFDPTEDILVEGDETVVLTGAATGLTSGSATLTITDNDIAPMAVTLSLNPSTVDEGAAATDITVTASLGSTTLPTATEVTVSVSGGTATSGMDYAAVSDFTVTIPANAASGTATLSFDPTEDILVEGDETVVLTGAATGLTSGSATLTITDNAVAADRAALVALYNATDGPNWTDKTNWLSVTEPIGNWRGVTTNADGRVTTLDLPSNGLSGALPTQLGDLTGIEHLYLNNNALSGAIPTELGSLTSLTRLYLQGNDLSGGIPTQLGSLTSLTNLYLSDNELTGAIPTELGSLTSSSTTQQQCPGELASTTMS